MFQIEFNKKINPKYYYLVNKYGEYIDENYNFFHLEEKKLLLEKFKDLNWDGLYAYYELTQRCNLLSFHFLTAQIIKKYKINRKISSFGGNTGLQEMLWELLNPDDSEFS